MDYANRAEREAKLARALGRLSAQQQRVLFDLLGDPPRLENLPAEYWDASAKEWQGALTPEIEAILVDSAEGFMQSLPGLGVDWGLVNRGATDWARRYTYELVRGINDTTRGCLQESIGDYYERGLTLGQLRERLGRYFGPVRADMIATTEVTRASVEGERVIARELAGQGIQMVEVWQTNNDELVCPICGPRNGKPKGDGWTEQDGPPAHPRCRCWVGHELKKVEE